MKLVSNPSRETWQAIASRVSCSNVELFEQVRPVILDVKEEGDAALLRYAELFDKVSLASLVLRKDALSEIARGISLELKEALDIAYANIEKFHRAQIENFQPIETTSGVICWRESRGIEKVGLYIPGGTAPLFSTLLMLGIPAKIAGCSDIVVCTPPDSKGKVHPALAYVALKLELEAIYLAGGAQAIAAMTFGTESIPQVYKIFGPGNQYVTAAKSMVSQEYSVAIDMPAGPTEVLLVADKSANPAFLAADMLAQVEHGTDSQAMLLTTSDNILEQVREEVFKQLETLPRKEIAKKALSGSYGVSFPTIEEALQFSNYYAPEHLILSVENPEAIISEIKNAGSVFLGKYTPESFGDYASGTNHTLPTNHAARAYSGVSLESFQKKITFQKASKKGLLALGNVVERMARAEGLEAHARAVEIRAKEISKENKCTK